MSLANFILYDITSDKISMNLVNNRSKYNMKLFNSAISLFHRNSFKESQFYLSRFYCNVKKGTNENGTADRNVPSDTKAENDEHRKTPIEKDIESGITITSYNTVLDPNHLFRILKFMDCNFHFQHGFRLNSHLQVIGPIILFPRAVFSWYVESVEKIDVESLMIFGIIRPKVDNLIIGIGDHESPMRIGKTMLEFSHKHKISVDVLTTELVS